MEFLVMILDRLGRELQVFILSMVPVIELRGAIPLGAAYGLNWVENYLLAVAGNMLPVPFIILFIRHIFAWMKKKNILTGLVEWFETRAMQKSDIVMKYSAFGLMLFVAVPLPGTGAWTGALIAALLDMRLRYALLSVGVGVLIAGFIVSGVAYGFLGIFDWIL